MLPESYHPILVFSLEDLNIDLYKYCEYLKNYFFELEWDVYLYRQQKIEFLIKNALNNSQISSKINHLFCAYYKGEIGQDALEDLTKSLNSAQISEFEKIKHTRRRAMQVFEVNFINSEIIVNPSDRQSFIQKDALVSQEANDWRKLERIFNLPSINVITEELKSIIKYFAKKLLSYHPNLISINSYVHFIQIVAEPNKVASNSPEGIHQDGMDYVVSALVIDRENVKGGKSIIFIGNNTQQPLFEITLKKGFGLFQPDKGTDLWHVVEPITPLDNSKPAYRSTIGFDFELNFVTN